MAFDGEDLCELPEVLYEEGTGTLDYAFDQTDLTRAVRCFRRAAGAGSSKAKVQLGICYRKGLGVENNMLCAFQLFKIAAAAGDDEGRFHLGKCYLSGRGTEMNHSEAICHLKRAAAAGNLNAITTLGYCYSWGLGVLQNEKEAVRLYRVAKKHGKLEARARLGRCYALGKGVQTDVGKALRLLMHAADHENRLAKMFLGEMYEFGLGVKCDEDKARLLYCAVADKVDTEPFMAVRFSSSENLDTNVLRAMGYYRLTMEDVEIPSSAHLGQENVDVRAKVALGLRLKNGNGVEKNEKEAFRLFLEAAIHEDREGQYWLGVCFDEGKGVLRSSAHAMQLWKDACASGLPEAQVKIANKYLGEWNLLKAMEILKPAARKGYAPAKLKQGLCLLNGIYANSDEAFLCFESAAEAGCLDAMTLSALCYRDCVGTPQNFSRAVALLEMAIDRGCVSAYEPLAGMYLLGRGTVQDSEKAERTLRNGMGAGSWRSAFRLAMELRQGTMPIVDVEESNAILAQVFPECHSIGEMEFISSSWSKDCVDAYYDALVRIGKDHKVLEDLGRACGLFHISAENMHPDGCYELAVCHEDGEGVEKDHSKAFALFQISAQGGNWWAQLSVGMCYQQDDVVEQDMEMAFSLFHHLVEKGFDAARLQLAYCYYSGNGVEEDINESVRLFTRCAEKGDADATHMLGVIYDYEDTYGYDGFIVDVQPEWPMMMFRKAALMGNGLALSEFCSRYELNRMEPNKKEVFLLMKRSADEFDIGTYIKLGMCYRKGFGVPRNKQKAAAMFQDASDLGIHYGSALLGLAYLSGEGVPRDRGMALSYFRQAVNEF